MANQQFINRKSQKIILLDDGDPVVFNRPQSISGRKTPPIQEGSLAEIFKLFIAPLAKSHKKKGWVFGELMELIFHSATRTIELYQARRTFRMEGMMLVDEAIPVQGLGYRTVPKGTLLHVRSDTTQSYVDIELNIGRGQTTHIYRLTTGEYERIQGYLQLVPKIRGAARAKILRKSPYHNKFLSKLLSSDE